MADTIRGWHPNAVCDDCGREGVVFIHWGPLAPVDGGGPVNDCMDCWLDRSERYNTHDDPMPRGANMSKKVEDRTIHQCEFCGDGWYKLADLEEHQKKDHVRGVATK
jgi:hypothetical protein